MPNRWEGVRIGWIVAALVAVPLVAGCAVVIGGAGRPAAGMTPRPLTGQVIKQVLLDDGELSKLLAQSFKREPKLPPRFGGPDELSPLPASPPECAGVSFPLFEAAYRSADVKTVAQEIWFDDRTADAKVITVDEAVVALPTAADADALFAQFAEHWTQCKGTTVTRPSLTRFDPWTYKVVDAQLADSVLAASEFEVAAPAIPLEPEPVARALGVRVNCLVEVEVSFFSDHSADTTAIDVAHRMMDKVSDLS
jgi:hypothetical protein